MAAADTHVVDESTKSRHIMMILFIEPPCPERAMNVAAICLYETQGMCRLVTS
jgi:hypothetical protein